VKQLEFGRIAHALAFPLLIYLVHLILARATNYYIEFPWVDMPMHFVGGVAAAYGIDVMFGNRSKTDLVYLVWLLVLSVIAALLWEAGEYLQDQFRDGNSQVSVRNTLRDLGFGTLGSAVFVFFLVFKNKRVKVS
jgi:hypothetical protein